MQDYKRCWYDVAMTANKKTKPAALLLLGTHCPHCPQVLKALSELVKAGDIHKLEVINVEQAPEVARELGVRGVPWIRVGEFTLTRLHSLQELRELAQATGTVDGQILNLNRLLTSGQLDEAVAQVKSKPEYLDAIMEILAQPDAKINVRIGIGVIMEEFEGSETLQGYVEKLGELSRHEHASVRADACHYLALTGSKAAIDYLRAASGDDNPEVREIAEDGLEALNL